MPIETREKPIRLLGWRKDFHRHIEGGLFLLQLVQIAQEFGVGFSNETVVTIQEQLDILRGKVADTTGKKESKSIERFIRLLSTRWMRLIIAKIMVRPDLDDLTAQKNVSDCVARFIEVAVEHGVKVERLSLLNLLYCPLSLAVDGDLEDPQRITGELLKEEVISYQALASLKDHKKRGITWKQYVEIASKKRAYLEEKYGIRLILTTSFRKDRDQRKLQDPAWIADAGDFLDIAFISEQTDCVDLCGPERKEYALEKFPDLINDFGQRTFYMSIHGGEVRFEEKEVGYANLSVITQLPNVAFIPHGVRITDRNKRAAQINANYEKHPASILLNGRSNIETGLFKRLTRHRYIINKMKLGTNAHSAIVQVFRDAVPCSDDPAVYTDQPENTMRSEFHALLKALHSLSEQLFDGERVSSLAIMKMISQSMQRQEEDFDQKLQERRQQALLQTE